MKIKPKIRGFICTNTNPDGCFENVVRQIEYVKNKRNLPTVENALVIGGSTGYGLASRIVAAFGCNAKTINVSFEKIPTNTKQGSAGYYNTLEFERQAAENNLYAKSIFADAFATETKKQIADLISQELGSVDLIIYSIASPRRITPDGITYNSVIKPIGNSYQNKTIDLKNREITQVTIQSATDPEIEATIKVMGGEDLTLLLDFLVEKNCLSKNARLLAYSYIGPELTHPIYKDGTIGRAKDNLQQNIDCLNQKYKHLNLSAYLSVNKALVTQASSAIPVVPLYISMLYKIMKEKGLHEGCIEQIYRLFLDKLLVEKPIVDETGRIRIDDYEMMPEIQNKINHAWDLVSTSSINEHCDIDGYMSDFYSLFGFDYYDQ